jgi:hypothetical protein
MKRSLGQTIQIGLAIDLVMIAQFVFTAYAHAAQRKPAKQASVQERLQQLEDKEQIRDLLSRYMHYEDAGPPNLYAALFGKDGELVINCQIVGKGSEAILKSVLRFPETYQSKGAAHILSDIVIELYSNEAKTMARWTAIEPGSDGKPVIRNRGTYNDLLVRENGAWRFKRREIISELPVRNLPCGGPHK